MNKTAIKTFCDRVISSTKGNKFLEFLDIPIGTMVIPAIGLVLFIVSFFVRVEMSVLAQIYLYYKLVTLVMFIAVVTVVKRKPDSLVEPIVVLLKEIEATIIVFFYELFSRKKLSS